MTDSEQRGVDRRTALRRRTVLMGAASSLAVLAGCSDDGDGDAAGTTDSTPTTDESTPTDRMQDATTTDTPTPTPTPTPSPSPTPTPSPTPSPTPTPEPDREVTIDVEPGTAGVENTFTHTMDMSDRDSEEQIGVIGPGFGESPGVDMTKVTLSDLTIEGDDLGQVTITGIDEVFTDEYPKIWLEIEPFSFADESGDLVITTENLAVENAGEYTGWIDGFDTDDNKIIGITAPFAIDSQ